MRNERRPADDRNSHAAGRIGPAHAELENRASVGSFDPRSQEMTGVRGIAGNHRFWPPDVKCGPVIAALILAAGRSSRMGRSKALLPHQDGDTTFVAHAIRQARAAGLDAVFVVGRESDDELGAEVAREQGRFVVNPEPERGQLSSLVAGLDAIDRPDLTALIVMPVDVPLVSAAVMRTLLERAAATDASIVRAVHGGRHGHPVLFKRDVFDEVRSADPALGAKAVVRADPRRVLDVEVDDPGVLVDVDTPEDYDRMFRQRRQ